jgi:type VI secretion system ImpM family protein
VSAYEIHRAGVLGKVPSHAEFLPPPATPALFASFEGWLIENMEWALGRAGPRFPEAFGSGLMYGFAFGDAAAPASLLVGALSPSHDSAGRQFPLVFAALVKLSSPSLSHPELVPFLFEGLWATSIAALGSGLSGDWAQVEAAAASLDQEQAPDIDEASALYASWSKGLPIAELWPLLGVRSDPDLTLRWFLDAVAPLKSGSSTTNLSLRLPLGVLGGVGLCFWLELLRRAALGQRGLPSFFWSHDGQSGSVLIHLGKGPRVTLAELWLPTGERDEVADLMSGLGADLAAHLAPLPPVLAATLTGGGRVADLLACVG